MGDSLALLGASDLNGKAPQSVPSITALNGCYNVSPLISFVGRGALSLKSSPTSPSVISLQSQT